LESLNTFGEFHIEPSQLDQANIADYDNNISLIQERILDVDALTKQLVHEKGSLLGAFKIVTPVKVNVTADNWQELLQKTSQEILSLKQEIETLNGSLAGMSEKNLELMGLRRMLQNMESIDVDLQAVGDMKWFMLRLPACQLRTVKPSIQPSTGYHSFTSRFH
jgi:hypothetical protein